MKTQDDRPHIYVLLDSGWAYAGEAGEGNPTHNWFKDNPNKIYMLTHSTYLKHLFMITLRHKISIEKFKMNLMLGLYPDEQ